MVPLSVLLPVAVMENGQRAKRATPLAWVNLPMIAFAGIVLANQHANYNYFFNADHWRDDYRSAATFLNNHVEAGDASIMLWGEPYLLSYYGHSSVESLWRLEEPELIMNRINLAADSSDTVFVSINRLSSWNRHSQTLQHQLYKHYNLMPVANFHNFSIFQLKPRDPTLAMNPVSVTR